MSGSNDHCGTTVPDWTSWCQFSTQSNSFGWYSTYSPIYTHRWIDSTTTVQQLCTVSEVSTWSSFLIRNLPVVIVPVVVSLSLDSLIPATVLGILECGCLDCSACSLWLGGWFIIAIPALLLWIDQSQCFLLMISLLKHNLWSSWVITCALRITQEPSSQFIGSGPNIHATISTRQCWELAIRSTLKQKTFKSFMSNLHEPTIEQQDFNDVLVESQQVAAAGKHHGQD